MFTRLVSILAVGLAVALSASAALGQGFRGGRGGDDAFDPAVTTEQMEKYADMLDLSADQQAAALALLEAYQVEFEAAARPVRDKIENLRTEARETRDRTLWGELMEARGDFEETSEQMETTLLADVQALLTPEQAESGWPRVVRERRREQSLPRGLMSGERVDVIALVKDLDLSQEQSAALADTLNQYELELDLALIKRDQMQDEFRQNMRDLFRNGDQQAISDLFERGKQAATKVRDINSRAARQVEALLPPEPAATFAAQVRQRSFPMIYRPSYADRVIDAAAKFDDLTGEQKENIATIQAAFAQSITSINRRMETAQVEMEESMTAERLGAMFRNGGDNDAMRDLRGERRDLETSTIERLRSILTAEQAARLPERGDGDEDGGNRRNFRERRGDREGGQRRGGEPQRDGGT